MSNSFWGIGFVILGLFGIAFVLLFQNISATDNQNYYLLKEVAQAAMVDAVDFGRFSDYNEVRIYEEKFVESFVRRWSQSADRGRNYIVEIYDVVEMPPKVSLKVTSTSEEFIFDINTVKTPDSEEYGKEDVNFNIVGKIDAILESKY